MTEEPRIGSPAPGFTLPGTDDRPISLADYRELSLVVLFFVREHY